MQVCVAEGKRVQDHARLKVLAFRNAEDQPWITDEDDINEKFTSPSGSNGFVFSQNFYVKNAATVKKIKSSALVYQAMKNLASSEFGSVDKYKVWQLPKGSVHQILMTKKRMCQPEGYIDVEVLSAAAREIALDVKNQELVYVSSAGQVVGPFKCQKKTLTDAPTLSPVVGKSVHVWNYGQVDVAFDDEENCYLLEEPTIEKGEPYVCYTDSQLLKWLNDRVELEYKLTKKQRKKFEEVFTQTGNQEDILVAKLVGQRLSRLNLPFDLIEKISQTDATFQEAIRCQIEQVIHNFNEEAKAAKANFEARQLEYQSIISQAESQCVQLSEKLQKLNHSKQAIEQDYIAASTQITELQQRLEELVEFNRELEFEESEVAAQKYPKSFSVEKTSFDRELFVDDNQPIAVAFTGSFITRTKEIYGADYIDNSTFEAIPRLLNSRLSICSNPLLPHLFAKAVGRAQTFWQNVPPTWIDYDTFDKSIFSDVLKECRLRPAECIILVLDQFNMSPPSCYLGPLMAVCKKAAANLPRQAYGWPQNLWVFCIKGHVSDADAHLPVSFSAVSGAAFLDVPDILVRKPENVDTSGLKIFPATAFPPPAPYFDDNLKSICDDK